MNSQRGNISVNGLTHRADFVQRGNKGYYFLKMLGVKVHRDSSLIVVFNYILEQPYGAVITPRIVYDALSFTGISYFTVQKALVRLYERGVIIKVARGCYKRVKLMEYEEDEVCFVQRGFGCWALNDNVRVFLRVNPLLYRRLIKLGVVLRKGYVLIKDDLCDLRIYGNGLVYAQFRQPLPRGFDFQGYILGLFEAFGDSLLVRDLSGWFHECSLVLPYSEEFKALRDVGYVKVYFSRKFGHIRVEVYTSDWSIVRPALSAARKAIVFALTSKWL